MVIDSSMSEGSHMTSERCSVLMVRRAVSAPGRPDFPEKALAPWPGQGGCRQRLPADLSPADQLPLREAALIPYVGAFGQGAACPTRRKLALMTALLSSYL